MKKQQLQMWTYYSYYSIVVNQNSAGLPETSPPHTFVLNVVLFNQLISEMHTSNILRGILLKIEDLFSAMKPAQRMESA